MVVMFGLLSDKDPWHPLYIEPYVDVSNAGKAAWVQQPAVLALAKKTPSEARDAILGVRDLDAGRDRLLATLSKRRQSTVSIMMLGKSISSPTSLVFCSDPLQSFQVT
jgi:hypothetical protein